MTDEQTTAPVEVAKYFGTEKIISIVDGYKPGVKRVLTHSEGTDTGFGRDVPEWELNVVVSDAPKAEDECRNDRANYVVAKILTMLKDLDIRVEELSFTLQKVVSSFQANEQIVLMNAFGFPVQNHEDIAGVKNEIRISTWSRILGKE